jgi:hypothetical protein
MQEMRKVGSRNKECMKGIEEGRKRKTLKGRNKKKSGGKLE